MPDVWSTKSRTSALVGPVRLWTPKDGFQNYLGHFDEFPGTHDSKSFDNQFEWIFAHEKFQHSLIFSATCDGDRALRNGLELGDFQVVWPCGSHCLSNTINRTIADTFYPNSMWAESENEEDFGDDAYERDLEYKIGGGEVEGDDEDSDWVPSEDDSNGDEGEHEELGEGMRVEKLDKGKREEIGGEPELPEYELRKLREDCEKPVDSIPDFYEFLQSIARVYRTRKCQEIL
jgi:hypothetical protein